MVSGGILKSGTIVREYNAEKYVVGISEGKIMKKKKQLERAEFLERTL